MIIIKKYLVLISTLVLVLYFASTASAVNEKANDKAKTQNTGNTQVKTNPSSDKKAEKTPPPTKTVISRGGLQKSLIQMDEVMEEIEDPEVVEEIVEIQEEGEKSQKLMEKSLSDMKARPAIVRFIMGPDYKNAGQVRSQIVRTRNQIRQLTNLQEKVAEEEKAGIQATIETLNQELNAIQTRLNTGLEGFSLLGWLSRLMSGFTPLPAPSTTEGTATPVPSGEPEATASASPVPTTEPTDTPLPSINPTIEPGE